MPIPVEGGGDQGVFLYTACVVKSSLQTIVAVVGDIVEISTSGNWVVDEHSTDLDFDQTGIIRELSDDKKACTVQWATFNKVLNVATSGSPSLGNAVICAATQTESFIGSANSTSKLIATYVAVDVPASGYADVITR